MFKHQHPYPPFIPENATKLIVGTLPPPRFTTHELLEGDVDCWYGSRDGQLWQIIDRIFSLNLEFSTTQKAIQQRTDFLNKYGVGICDMVEYAWRKKIDATDLGIQRPRFRPLVPILKQHPNIKRILFTGGNSKNGPEYFFRQYLKKYPKIHLELVNAETPKIYQFELTKGRIIETVSLTAPSGSANRAVGSMELYKKMKDEDPNFDTISFRVLQYAPFFK